MDKFAVIEALAGLLVGQMQRTVCSVDEYVAMCRAEGREPEARFVNLRNGLANSLDAYYRNGLPQ